MKRKFYSVQLFIIPLLMSMGIGNGVRAQLVTSISVVNQTTISDGSQASRGDILEYTIADTNSSSTSNAVLTAYIPAGTVYVTGSTTVNGSAVADVNGNMPYTGSGGTLAAGQIVKIIYRVQVTATVGTVTNYTSLQIAGSSAVNSNTVSTVLDQTSHNYWCAPVYMSTGNTATATSSFLNVRVVNPTNGTAQSTVYLGGSGDCYHITNNADGSYTTAAISTRLFKNVSAMGYDPNIQRLYFVNNSTTAAQNLCFIDLSYTVTTSPAAYEYAYQLETTTGTGYNITRMTFASDGYGYALTENGLDFIRFYIDANNKPVINRLGQLTNDSAANGTHDVISETGGDMCSDGSGGMYFIPNSGNVYRIAPATRVATYMGTISGMPTGGCSSLAMDENGNIYMGGAYQNVYKVTLSTMTAVSITGGTTTNVWTSGDFASCTMPVHTARVVTGSASQTTVDAELNDNIAVQVRPNPFHTDMNLQIPLKTAETVQVRLIDFYGRTVFVTSEKLGAGLNSVHLAVPAGLSQGVYVLEIRAGQNRLVQKKLVKQ